MASLLHKSFAFNFLLILSFFFVFAYSLEFNSNGEYTILQFTDFHLCEDDASDAITLSLMKQMLATVKPDLVVVSGDAVAGYRGWRFELFTHHGFFKNCWKKFTAPFAEFNVPYAYTLGNHDADGDLNREQIAILDQTNPLSVRKNSTGMENSLTFTFPIYSSKIEGQPAANIWMFDTGSLGCAGIEDSWGCIEQPQLEWYDKESLNFKKSYGENINHIAFIHIPIPEYVNVYDNGEFYGVKFDGIGCPHVNTGFFDHVKSNGDITAMFAGHDHNNDYGGFYEDVELVYGRKSGQGSYGNVLGSRVIKFKEELDSEGKLNVTRSHYVIYANGTIRGTTKMEKREGVKEGHCPKAGDNWFLLLRATRIFDHVLMVLEIILVMILVLLVCRTARKHSKIGKFSKFEDEVAGGAQTQPATTVDSVTTAPKASSLGI